MGKKKVIIAIAILAVVSLIVGACTVLISASTELSEENQQTKSIIVYRPPIPRNEGDPDDLGGGFRNNL